MMGMAQFEVGSRSRAAREGGNGMPNIGDTRSRNGTIDIWSACVNCGKERWVRRYKGQPLSSRCLSCSKKGILSPMYGRSGSLNPNWKGGWRELAESNPNWKGGSYIGFDQYIYVRVYPDNFFFPMADKRGYIREHRLVMAKHLGRCLQPWEIVHHKNGVKADNRIANLDLSSNGSHSSSHSKGYRDGFQKGYEDGKKQAMKELTQGVKSAELFSVPGKN